jgi:hypothetical protein
MDGSSVRRALRELESTGWVNRLPRGRGAVYAPTWNRAAALSDRPDDLDALRPRREAERPPKEAERPPSGRQNGPAQGGETASRRGKGKRGIEEEHEKAAFAAAPALPVGGVDALDLDDEVLGAVVEEVLANLPAESFGYSHLRAELKNLRRANTYLTKTPEELARSNGQTRAGWERARQYYREALVRELEDARWREHAQAAFAATHRRLQDG